MTASCRSGRGEISPAPRINPRVAGLAGGLRGRKHGSIRVARRLIHQRGKVLSEDTDG